MHSCYDELIAIWGILIGGNWDHAEHPGWLECENRIDWLLEGRMSETFSYKRADVPFFLFLHSFLHCQHSPNTYQQPRWQAQSIHQSSSAPIAIVQN